MTEQTDRPRWDTVGLARIGFWILFGLVLLFGVVLAYSLRLNFDAGWYLVAARQLVEGQELYVDIIEINPPLIVWLSVIPSSLADLTGLSDGAAMATFVLILIGMTLAVSDRVLQGFWSEDVVSRRAVLFLIPVVMIGPLGKHFGEREHLLVILTFSYLLLAALRVKVTARPPGTFTSLAAGAMAAVGVALKPHFVLLLLTVEAYVLVRRGVRDWFARPELRVIGIFLLAYGAAVLLLTPEYLDVLALVMSLYASLDLPLRELVVRAEIATVGAALVVSLGLDRKDRWSIGAVFAIAALAYAVIAIVQQKGWQYHYYPAFASASMLIGIGAVQGTRRLLRPPPRTIAYGAFGGIIVSRMAFLALYTFLGAQRGNDVEREVAARADGGDIIVLSTEIGGGFPLVNNAEVGWALRHPSLWFLPSFYSEEQRTDGVYAYRKPAEQGELERRLFQHVVEDFVQHRPELLLAMDRVGDPGFPRGRFDYLGYYAQDPAFAKLLSRYERIGRIGVHVLYQRRLDAHHQATEQ